MFKAVYVVVVPVILNQSESAGSVANVACIVIVPTKSVFAV
jgi:hypothetical protein